MNGRCEYPFHSVAIQPNGDITPCCAYTGSLGNFSATESMTDFLKNNENLNQLKLNETLGIQTDPGCNKCYSNTESEASRKFIFKNSVSKYKQDSNDEILHLDMSFGNRCNLSCAMCSSKYSSKLRNIELAFEDRWATVSDIFDLTPKDIDKILDAATNLKVIELKGGEPLMYKDSLEYFLNQVYEKYGPSLRVYITTNFSKITSDIAAIIKNFKNVKLIISIDGVGDTYEWIRGFNFGQLESLIQTFGPDLKNNIDRFNFCSSIFNLGNIQNFYDWSVELSDNLGTTNQIPTSFSIISRDCHTSVLLTPKKLQAIEIVDSLLAKSESSCTFTNNTLKVLRSYLNNNTINDSESIQRFYKWYKHIDSFRSAGLPEQSVCFFPRKL